MKRFFGENLVCLFGLPHTIVSDNGTQIEKVPFRGWCEKLKIKHVLVSVAHPKPTGWWKGQTVALCMELSTG